MKKAVLAGVLCVGVGLIVGTGARVVGAAHRPARAAAPPCPTGQLRVAGVPGTRVLDGIAVTASAPQAIGAQPGDRLAPGYIFQVVHVTMRDIGAATYQYSAYDFAALNGTAKGYPITVNDNNLTQPISTGVLRPGGTVSGELAYEMPRGETPAAMLWSPGQIGKDTPLSQVVFLP